MGHVRCLDAGLPRTRSASWFNVRRLAVRPNWAAWVVLVVVVSLGVALVVLSVKA